MTLREACFDRFILMVDSEDALECSMPARDATQSVETVLDLDDNIQSQLAKIRDADLADELREYGAWDDDELRDRRTNEERILWIASCNIRDEMYENREI